MGINVELNENKCEGMIPIRDLEMIIMNLTRRIIAFVGVVRIGRIALESNYY